VAVLSAAALALIGAPAQAATSAPASSATADSASDAGPSYQASCSAPKPGTFSCFALRSTVAKEPVHGPMTSAAATPTGYGPSDLQSAYALPSGGGAGQTIAIVDAYDDPSAESDLAIYRQQYGLPSCTGTNGCFRKVDQTGSTQYPPADAGWDQEISLDLDMVSAIAPEARILLVEADDSSSANLAASVDEAVALGAKFVSNSYGSTYTSVAGSGEDPSDTTFDAYYDHPGVAVVASSGDSGYGVAYPAASPYVTAVGGTSLTRATGTSRGWTETAWAGAGSGCSVYEPKPAFQHDSGCANRSVADVSAVANPATGVAVYDSAIGWSVFGGTSVASPIIASVYADAGTPAIGTDPNTYPYAASTGLNDVIGGTNGSCTVGYACNAVKGYDGPTGLGTPDGLAAFRTGPQGTLSGTVTNRADGKPVVGARVSDGTDVAQTDTQGHYSLTVPAGRHTLTVTAYGYETSTVRVSVAAGATVAENIKVSQVPSETVSGIVTDGSGQGYPLYAQVSVSGDPNSVWTDPLTGRYTLTLPQNADYTLDFAPAAQGYDEVTKTVHVATAPVSVDAAASADAWQATAPGYKLSLTGPTETFESTTSAPTGWSVVNASGTTAGWEFDDPGNRGNQTGGSGGFAIADSNHYGFSSEFNTSLDTPVYDFTNDTRPEVAFDTFWSDNPYYETFDVQASDDGGADWSTVWTPDAEVNAGGYLLSDAHFDVQLTAYAGKPSVQLRFQYTAHGAWYWGIDDVFVGQRNFLPVSGGLVVGTVQDANTGQGVSDATVTDGSDASVQAQSIATPQDPNLGDGYYSLFTPGTGEHTLTTTKFDYSSAQRRVDVSAGSAVEGDTQLKAGRLQVNPGALTASTALGKSTTRTLTITDTGTAPATVEIGDQGRVASPNTVGAPLERIAGMYPTGRTTGTSQSQKQTQSAGPSAAMPDDAWQSVQNLPSAVMDDIADSYDGKVYAGYGDPGLCFGNCASNSLYVLDPSAGAWTQLASATDGRSAPGHGIIGGKLYVAGGWADDGSNDPTLEIYDIASNTWTTGASDPAPYAGSGSAVLDGKLYLVGGCSDSACGSAVSDSSVYDPTTNTWSQIATYPEPIDWTSCAGIDGKLYCGGGTDSTGAAVQHAYVYDPAANTWSPLPDMPTPLWGASYSAADGMLVISSGVTTGNVLTNQSEAYDPQTNSWSALPNATTATYRGAGALGFYKVGGGLNGLTATTDVEYLAGYAVNPAANVPWLAESRNKLTLLPHQRVTVTVTLGADTTQIAEAGTYNADLVFGSDTPYTVASVPVTLTVAPPKGQPAAAKN
jgi:N-acetylneuraminic acid mutarotase